MDFSIIDHAFLIEKKAVNVNIIVTAVKKFSQLYYLCEAALHFNVKAHIYGPIKTSSQKQATYVECASLVTVMSLTYILKRLLAI